MDVNLQDLRYGQGKPLPADAPYNGQWLIEPRLFLYRSDGKQTVKGTAPRFTAGFRLDDGDWSYGFDAEQIAHALGLAESQVFDANRRFELDLAASEAKRTAAGRMAKSYRFTIGRKSVVLTIESDSSEKQSTVLS